MGIDQCADGICRSGWKHNGWMINLYREKSTRHARARTGSCGTAIFQIGDKVLTCNRRLWNWLGSPCCCCLLQVIVYLLEVFSGYEPRLDSDSMVFHTAVKLDQGIE